MTTWNLTDFFHSTDSKEISALSKPLLTQFLLATAIAPGAAELSSYPNQFRAKIITLISGLDQW